MDFSQNNYDRETQALASFIQKYAWLAEFRILEFLKDEFWKNDQRIPQGWRDFADTLSEVKYVEELLAAIDTAWRIGGMHEEEPTDNPLIFMRACYMHSFFDTFSSANSSKDHVTKRNGIKLKKTYEVERVSQVIMDILSSQEAIHTAVDIGAGQGYLAFELLDHPHCPLKEIYAVEPAEIQLHGLMKRIPENILASNKLKIVPKRLCSTVDACSFEDFIFTEKRAYLLYSLHACGSLSDAMLKIFCDPESNARCLVNIGCCYNLITEDSSAHHFPISRKCKEFVGDLPLTRNQKMIACQAPYRWHLHQRQTRNFFKRHYYRALLELLFSKLQLGTDFLIGNIPDSMLDSFPLYCSAAFTNLGLPVPPHTTLSKLETTYNHMEKYLAFMWTMRSILGPALERLILFDRAHYIRENLKDARSIRLDPVFDPYKSPRNMALIVIK